MKKQSREDLLMFPKNALIEVIDYMQQALEYQEEKINKAIKTIEQLKEGSYIEYTDTTALAYHTPQPCCIARLDVIEKKLRGEDNEKQN